ncbi:MAG: PP2C family protein-serine/threonine phosphatase [Zavarzinella sp.]
MLEQDLAANGFQVDLKSPTGIHPDSLPAYQCVVFDAVRGNLATVQALSRRWRIELGDHYLPIIVVLDSGLAPTTVLESGADAVVPAGSSTIDLIAQINALSRVGYLCQRLALKANEATQLNQKLHNTYQRVESNLMLERRVHREVLSVDEWENDAVSCASFQRLRSRHGGDFFSIQQVAPDQVCFLIGDSMGRTNPSGYLINLLVVAIFRKILETKKFQQPLEPTDLKEILQAINRDIVGLQSPEPVILSMLALTLDVASRRLVLIRAGHPHPFLVTASGTTEYWNSGGSFLGIFEARFDISEKKVAPGDRIFLFTDGFLNKPEDGKQDRLPVIASDTQHETIVQSVQSIGKQFVEHCRPYEDFTLVGIEVKR